MDLQQLDFDLPVPGYAHLLNARAARKAKQQRVEAARAYEYARWLHYKKTA